MIPFARAELNLRVEVQPIRGQRLKHARAQTHCGAAKSDYKSIAEKASRLASAYTQPGK
jgi:hypothetical protein